jgi:hypothetical protein
MSLLNIEIIQKFGPKSDLQGRSNRNVRSSQITQNSHIQFLHGQRQNLPEYIKIM